MPKNKEILSTKELADLLGISRIAVFNKIKRGQIKAQRVGRNYIIYRKDILDLVSDDISDQFKEEIDKGVTKVVQEYGNTLKMLGDE